MAAVANITAAPVTATAAPKKAAAPKAAAKEGAVPAELQALFAKYHNEAAAAKVARGEASALTRAAALTRAELLGVCLNPPTEWKTTARLCVDNFKLLGKLSEVENAVIRGARLA
jgi:hypothetical protein